MFRWLGVSIAALVGLAGVALASSAQALELKCSTLNDIALPHANVTKVTTEPLPTTGKACHVWVTSKPTPDSDIRIEVWIPVGAAWNGKFVQLGTGSPRGQAPMALAARGFAVAASESRGRDRSVRPAKETADIAKTMISAIKGVGPMRAYFSGCGEGGREALEAAARFPNDFDGVIAGSPEGADGVRPNADGLRAHSVRLIQYQGRSDAAYYQALADGGDPSGFYRLYISPALARCNDEAAPIDWLRVLDQWSADGIAPSGLAASGGGDLVCPYPLSPQMRPGGARCAAPGGPPPPPRAPPRRRPRH